MRLTCKRVLWIQVASPASVKSVSARRGAFDKCCPNYDDISDFTAQEMSHLTEELHLTKGQSFLEVGGGLVALYVAFHSNVGEVHGYEFSSPRHKTLTKWLNELSTYRDLYRLAPHATELSKLKDFDVHAAAANVIFCNTAAIAKDVFSSIAEQLSDLMTPENILVLTTDPWTRATRSSPPPFKLYKVKTLESGLDDTGTTLFFFQHPRGTRPSELVEVEEVSEDAHSKATSPSRAKNSHSKTAKTLVASPPKIGSPKPTAASKAEPAAASTPNRRRRHTEIFAAAEPIEEPVAVASPRARASRRSLAPSVTEVASPAKRTSRKHEEPEIAPAASATSARHSTKTDPRSPAKKTEAKVATPGSAPGSPTARRSRAKPVVEEPEEEEEKTPVARVRKPARRASMAAPSTSMEVDEPAPAPTRTRAVKAAGSTKKVIEEEEEVLTSTPKKRAAPKSVAAKAATEVKKRTTAARTPAIVDDIDLPAPSTRRKRTRIEAPVEEEEAAADSSDSAEVAKPPKRQSAANARASMKAVHDYVETDEEDDFERPKKKVARFPIKSPSKSSADASPAEEEPEETAPAASKPRRAVRRPAAGTSSLPARVSRSTTRSSTAATATLPEADAPAPQGWFSWLWNWIPATSTSSE